jgi:hypothetical protein
MSTARIDQIPTRRSFIPNGAIIRAMESPDTGGRLDITFSSDAIHTRLNALAPRQGVWFEGPVGTGGRSALSTLSSAIGTSDFSVNVQWTPPVANPSASSGLFYVSTSDTSFFVARGFTAFVSTTGALTVRLVGATTGDARIANVTQNLVTNYGGKPISLTITRSASGLAIYINGASVAYTETTAGTPPAWTDTVDGTNLRVGSYNTSTNNLANAAVSSFVLYNFALPATTTSGVPGVDVRYADGVWVRPSEQWGNSTNLQNANVFASTNLSSFTNETATGYDGVANGTSLQTAAKTFEAIAAPLGLRRVGAPTFRVRGSLTLNSGVAPFLSIIDSTSSFSLTITSRTAGNTTTAGAFDIVLPVLDAPSASALTWLQSAAQAPRLSVRHANGESGDYTITIDSLTIVGSTLDLQPQGIGRTIIDRSANRNHATVSGTTLPTYLQPTDGGKIVTRTNATPNQQLLALAAFDAANRYRITSWTVTALTGTPTISLGNASAGAQYVSGLTLATGVPTAITLLTSIAATANLWCASDSTDVIIHTITYERISD